MPKQNHHEKAKKQCKVDRSHNCRSKAKNSQNGFKAKYLQIDSGKRRLTPSFNVGRS
jgi:hypothetical protein